VKGKESESRRRGQRTEQRENRNAVFQLVWGSSLVVPLSQECKAKRRAALNGRGWAVKVKESCESKSLKPVSTAERSNTAWTRLAPLQRVCQIKLERLSFE